MTELEITRSEQYLAADNNFKTFVTFIFGNKYTTDERKKELFGLSLQDFADEIAKLPKDEVNVTIKNHLLSNYIFHVRD